MLDAIHFDDVRKEAPGPARETGHARYFEDIVSSLYSDELDALAADLVAYEDAGLVTTRVDDILRRVWCLVDADRLLQKFSGISPRRAA